MNGALKAANDRASMVELVKQSVIAWMNDYAPSMGACSVPELRALDQGGVSRSNDSDRVASLPARWPSLFEHYHHERNHQGLDNLLIVGTPAIDIASRVRRRPRLGGLLNFYEGAA
jgi:hypothetical protein